MSIFAFNHQDNHRTALVEGDKSISYGQLEQQIQLMATGLLAESQDLEEQRIAFFLPASIDYVVTMHGVWRAGGIAVPLNVASKVSELEHYLSSAGVSRLIAKDNTNQELTHLCQSLDIELVTVAQVMADSAKALPSIAVNRRAMMLFTSGTTSKPKGVVTTHKTIAAQINTLIKAWHWSDEDVIPLFLPLHHVHGIINVLSCGLAAGACVDLYASFDMAAICEKVKNHRYSVFMAVPTIYVKLIQYFDKLEQTEVDEICAGFKAMRLNISGSAACPVKLFNQWQQLCSQVLLERYGMTEIGMGISNPYSGERRAGHVGQPLDGVSVALFDENHQVISEEQTPGEIRIKGDNVFLEYWQNAKATEESFIDGWFCTGDVAVLADGYYRIMGRASIDIIKSGGYKLSALEIEGTLLLHPDVMEVAVIGVEDETWGEKVVAFVVLKPETSLEYQGFKSWCESKMSSYKIPKTLKVVEALPRNAMGKVMKPQLKHLV